VDCDTTQNADAQRWSDGLAYKQAAVKMDAEFQCLIDG
jgi:hypothetical protein